MHCITEEKEKVVGFVFFGVGRKEVTQIQLEKKCLGFFRGVFFFFFLGVLGIREWGLTAKIGAKR